MVRTVTGIESFVEVFAEHEKHIAQADSQHDLTGSLDLKNIAFVGVDFGVPDLPGVDFSGSSLVDSVFCNIVASNCTWVSGGAVGSNFAKSRFWDSHFERVVFERCNLMRTECSSSSFENVNFVDCNLTKTGFFDCKFSHVVFENCRFDRSFLNGAVFDRVSVLGPSLVHRVQVNDVRVQQLVEGEEDPVALLKYLDSYSGSS